MKRIFTFTLLLLAVAGMSSASPLMPEDNAPYGSPVTELRPGVFDVKKSHSGLMEPSAAGAGDITVTCKIKYDATLLSPLRVEALFPVARPTQVNCISYDGVHGMTTQVFKLAPGTYDFHVEFCNYDSELPANRQMDFYNPRHHVFKESVEVSKDMEIELDAATATNYIAFEPVTPSGDPYRHPVLKGTAFDYTDCNVTFETLALTITNSVYGEVQTSYTTSSHITSDGRSVPKRFDLYINNVSDKFTFAQTRMAVSPENMLYLVGLSSKGIPTSPVTNAGKAFTAFEEKFQLSPVYDKLRHDLYRAGMDVYARVNGLQTLRFDHLSAYTFPKAMIGWSAKPSPDITCDFHMWPRVYEMDAEGSNPDDRTQLQTKGCPMYASSDGFIYQNYSNPYFKWNREKLEGMMGDNVPLTSLVMHAVTASDGTKSILYAPSCVGRYGETRQTDLALIKVEVRHNGDLVHSSYADLNTWATTWATNGHQPGVMTTKFINTNTLVDGMTGRSELEVTYTEGQNDMCAPATQLLAFSDKNGIITQRFAPGQPIVVELAAGDPNGNGKRYTYMDARSVKFEYAPYGTYDYKEVKMNLIQGATSSSAWSVYGGEISDPTGSNNGWYDVRMTVVDNERNQSVQTLSPAFKVSADAGIDDVLTSDRAVSVKCSGRHLTVTGVENPAVDIYATSGCLVLSTRGNDIDVSALTSGLYLVKVNTETYKIIIR